MSEYYPPTEIVSIFNPLLYPNSGDILTLADASKQFLSISGGALTGTLFGQMINCTSFSNSGSTALLLTTDATSYTAGGALTISGGLAVAKKAYIQGTLTLGANITAIGTISGSTLSLTSATPTISSTATVSFNNSILCTGGVAPTTTNGINIRFNGIGSTGYINAYNFLTSTQQNLSINNNAIYCKADGSIGFNNASPLARYDFSMGSNTANRLRISYSSGVACDQYCSATGIHSFTNSLDITGDCNISGNFKINGSVLAGITSAQATLLSATQGTASASKCLIVDANIDITGIRYLYTTQLTGTLQTASQPNITSLGTLTGINLNGSMNLTGATTINNLIQITNNTTPAVGNGLEISFIGASSTGIINAYNRTLVQQDNLSLNNNTIYCQSNGDIGFATASPTAKWHFDMGSDTAKRIRLAYSGSVASDMWCSATGVHCFTNAILSGSDVSVPAGSNFLINGVALVGISSAQATLLSATAGTASASKALIVDANIDIGSIRKLSTVGDTNLGNGLLFCNVATGMTGIYTVSPSARLEINQSSSTANRFRLSYTKDTIFSELYCDSLGFLQMASINCQGFSIQATSISATELGYLNGITPGTALANKALICDASKNITSMGGISCDSLYSTSWNEAGSYFLTRYGNSQPTTSYGLSMFYNNSSNLGSIVCASSYAGTPAYSKLLLGRTITIDNATKCCGWNTTTPTHPIHIAGSGDQIYLANTVDSSGSGRCSITYYTSDFYTMETGVRAFGESQNGYYFYSSGPSATLASLSFYGNFILGNAGVWGGVAGMELWKYNSYSYSSAKIYNVDTNSYSTVGASSVNLSLYCSKNIWISDSIFTSSDRRIKHDIEPYDIDKELFMRIKPVKFTRNDNSKREIGFIAQDMIHVEQKIVEFMPKKLPIESPDDTENQMTIDYSKMSVINTTMIQKLIKELEMKTIEINALRDCMDDQSERSLRFT